MFGVSAFCGGTLGLHSVLFFWLDFFTAYRFDNVFFMLFYIRVH